MRKCRLFVGSYIGGELGRIFMLDFRQLGQCEKYCQAQQRNGETYIRALNASGLFRAISSLFGGIECTQLVSS